MRNSFNKTPSITALPHLPMHISARSSDAPGPVKDAVTAAFRMKRAVIVTCLVFSFALIGYLWFRPRVWESSLTILVRNTRTQIEVGPQPAMPSTPVPVDDSQVATELPAPREPQSA